MPNPFSIGALLGALGPVAGGIQGLNQFRQAPVPNLTNPFPGGPFAGMSAPQRFAMALAGPMAPLAALVSKTLSGPPTMATPQAPAPQPFANLLSLQQQQMMGLPFTGAPANGDKPPQPDALGLRPPMGTPIGAANLSALTKQQTGPNIPAGVPGANTPNNLLQMMQDIQSRTGQVDTPSVNGVSINPYDMMRLITGTGPNAAAYAPYNLNSARQQIGQSLQKQELQTSNKVQQDTSLLSTVQQADPQAVVSVQAMLNALPPQTRKAIIQQTAAEVKAMSGKPTNQSDEEIAVAWLAAQQTMKNNAGK